MTLLSHSIPQNKHKMMHIYTDLQINIKNCKSKKNFTSYPKLDILVVYQKAHNIFQKTNLCIFRGTYKFGGTLSGTLAFPDSFNRKNCIHLSLQWI